MFPIAAWLHSRCDQRNPTPVEAHHRGSAAPLAGVGSPFARAVSKWPGLAPIDGRPESIAAWASATGATPDDIADIRELMGWPLPIAIPEAVAVPTPEPERPPQISEIKAVEFPERPEPPPIVVETRIIPGMPARRAIEKTQAAVQFVEWVRLAGKCGTYSNREFSDLCAEFFEAEDILPISENMFRPVLEGLREDITKSRSDDRYSRNGRKSRNRHYRWTVHEAETELDTLPWSELPECRERQAA